LLTGTALLAIAARRRRGLAEPQANKLTVAEEVQLKRILAGGGDS
jgi:hypothetical protein